MLYCEHCQITLRYRTKTYVATCPCCDMSMIYAVQGDTRNIRAEIELEKPLIAGNVSTIPSV
jgi:hypothetical protein